MYIKKIKTYNLSTRLLTRSQPVPSMNRPVESKNNAWKSPWYPH